MATKSNIHLHSFHATELPEEEQAAILQSIGECETSRKTCLEELRRMLIVSGGVDFKPCLEEEFLMKFLRCSKFNCNKAYSRVKSFYDIQKKLPDFFEFCSENALSKATLNYTVASPLRLKDNIYTDPVRLPVKEKYYLDMLLGYYALKNPLNQQCGTTLFCDAAGLSFSILSHYSDLKYVRAITDTLQGTFPFRFKNIHIFNTSEIVRILYKIAYPFLSKKLRSRLHFYSDDLKELHRYVPPEVLPEEYGGHLKESDLINELGDIQTIEKYFRRHSPRLFPIEKSTKK